MAIWKETSTPKKDTTTMTPEPAFKQRESEFSADVAPIPTPGPRRAASRDARESVIAADIMIEGKIEGAGHVRLAGRFKGDVHIQGDLTIDTGAKLTGSVRANSVAIGGDVEGNIESAARVELLETGVLTGDLKAGTLTVAAGSRMRGRAEFGWGDEQGSKSGLTLGSGQTS
ncbi:MAG TPA: polymer-forming cytoskeletal protein [Gemmatimonadaceae bacterium]|nr:polymer-forming cytoskeletal protein [Gemmatimonadaceae bacterium]